MKAITVEPGRPGSARLEDIPEPDSRYGSALIETVAVGVCGTDLEIAQGTYGWAPPGKKRLVLGHESLGRVIEPGTSGALRKGAIQMGATIYDLEEAELCYAPQFGSAKDPVNFAGMVAADILRGDMPLCHWTDGEGFLLDVREPVELSVEDVPGALNIPLGQLRSRLDELPRDREIHVFCRSGQRAYAATRLLLQNGFRARNLSGGILARAILSPAGRESTLV